MTDHTASPLTDEKLTQIEAMPRAEDIDTLLAEVRSLRAELDAEKSAHLFTLRQRNNRSNRLIELRDLALAGDTDALLAAAKDTLAASVHDHDASRPAAVSAAGVTGE